MFTAREFEKIKIIRQLPDATQLTTPSGRAIRYKSSPPLAYAGFPLLSLTGFEF
ncbi:MAG: hypothetical protein NTY88_03535 [Bacteroidetes bacterium]|nr:hypothetical protein [Bacteroidota bacterium]